MEDILANLSKYFPSLPPNALKKIYRMRAERMRMLMINHMPADIRWIIEVRVRLYGETVDLYIPYMPSLETSIYSKKRLAKQLGVYYKCARMTCNTRCRTLGMVSDNREDKIQFVRDGMIKETLDDISSSLEMHPSGYVHIAIRKLHTQFQKEQQQYSFGNLTKKDYVCQFIRKLDGKPIPDP